jgi:hypothetical protein
MHMNTANLKYDSHVSEKSKCTKYRQVLFYATAMFLKNVMQIKHKITI